ncbi:MAG: tRNA lysidine(34) synthetase TilS [bacterium]
MSKKKPQTTSPRDETGRTPGRTAHRVISRVLSTIAHYHMIEPGSGIVAGVSGGPDSCALLLALHTLAKDLDLKIRVAHVNHGLRGADSDEDERFVKRLAAELDLPFHRKKILIAHRAAEKGENLEATARTERYAFFGRLARRYRCCVIATGHNLDDQAETVLHHIVRSSGIEGLSGIAPVWTIQNCKIVRPLLQVKRAEILRFLQAAGRSFRTDESNLDTALTRNYLRHEILPKLERINPNVREALGRLAEIARAETEAHEREDTDWLDRYSERSGKDVVLRRDAFCALPIAGQRRIVRRLLDLLAPSLHITLEIVDSIRDLAQSPKGGRKRLLRGHAVVSRQRDQLIFSPCESVVRSKRTGSRRPSG